MTFRELAVGDRFLFLRDDKENARREGIPILAEIRIVERTKTSAHEYTCRHADGDHSWGRVGCGDNPVRRLS